MLYHHDPPGRPFGQGTDLEVKVSISLYLLDMLMDQVDTLHIGRYRSEVLCPPGRPFGQGTDLEIL